MFEWRNFLDQHRINYVTSGPNVGRNNVAVRCPFCVDDPSQHMGISLSGKGWGCLRNPEHRGRSPVRLVAALLGCSLDQAGALTGTHRVIPENFLDKITELLQPPKPKPMIELKVPPEFKPLANIPACRHFVQYLTGRERGFTTAEIARMTPDFEMMQTKTGDFAWRVIFLVRFNGKLVTWTGRHIGDNAMRYKTLSPDPDKERHPAAGPINDYLLWYDGLRKGHGTIVLCEGPFDALKIRMLARRERRGVLSTCFFTASPSRAQVDLLHEVLPRYRNRILLLDQGTLATAMHLRAALRSLDVQVRTLPSDVSDPGRLNGLDILD